MPDRTSCGVTCPMMLTSADDHFEFVQQYHSPTEEVGTPEFQFNSGGAQNPPSVGVDRLSALGPFASDAKGRASSLTRPFNLWECPEILHQLNS